MDEDFGIPGTGTWAAPGWGGSSTTAPTYTPPREADTMPTSRSAVPGTSGSPSSTPSAYGGMSGGQVHTGAPGSQGGTPSWIQNIFGSLSGQGAGPQPQTANQRQLQQSLQLANIGRAMMAPASPLRAGAPAPMLSAAGQNPMIANLMRLYGLNPQQAQWLLTMSQPGGGTAMTPQQQSQQYFGQAYAPPSQLATQGAPLLPPTALPTPQNPWGTPRGPMGPTTQLPRLGTGAFQMPTLTSPMQPYGAIA